VTTTVAIEGGAWPWLPVRNEGPAPKPLVADICRQLCTVALEAPVPMGKIGVADVLDTGVDGVATCDMPRQQAQTPQ